MKQFAQCYTPTKPQSWDTNPRTMSSFICKMRVAELKQCRPNETQRATTDKAGSFPNVDPYHFLGVEEEESKSQVLSPHHTSTALKVFCDTTFGLNDSSSKGNASKEDESASGF